MKASELYAAGKLDDAIEAMNAEVRAKPADIDKRGFLVELLCVAGKLDRADQQLETIGNQDPGAQIGIALVRQLVRAEQWRQQFWAEGRVPEFLGVPSPLLQMHLQASIFARTGDVAAAAGILAEAESVRPRIRGTSGGERFEDFRDLDDLSSSFLEVLTSTGKYYWIPLDRVRSMDFRKPERPRDLLWRRVLVSVADGPEGEVFLPAIYPSGGAGTAASVQAEAQLRLGRATDWSGGEGSPVRGRGLRTFLVGEESRTILELEKLVLGA